MYLALGIYKAVVAVYPGTREDEISRQQILSIVREIVPKEVLYTAQLNLALSYAKCYDESNT